MRVVRGEVIYRDFHSFYPPLSIYFPSLFYFLFGLKNIVTYILASLTFALIAIEIYYLASWLYRMPALALSVTVLTICPIEIAWYELSHHWFSTCTALGSLIFLLQYLSHKTRRSLFMAGFFIGLTILFLHTKGLVLLSFFVLFVSVKTLLLEKRFFKEFFIELTIALSGSLLPVLPFVIYLSINDALPRMFHYLFVWPFEGYWKFEKYPYYFYTGFKELQALFNLYPWYRAIWTARFWILGGILPIIAIFISAIEILYLIKKKQFKNLQVILAYFIFGFSLFVSVLYRSDLIHLYFILPLLLIIFFEGIFFVLKIMNISQKKIFLIATAISAIIIIDSIHLYIWNLYRVYSGKTVALETPTGTVYTRYEDASKWKTFFDFFKNKELKKGDVFIYSYSESLYFYLRINPPTPFNAIFPGPYTPAELNRTVEILREVKPEYVIKDALVEIILNRQEGSHPFARIEDFIADPVNKFIMENYKTLPVDSYLKIMQLSGL
jgi:4-amino-4-deoxy-L-arabinose transferase-like glycosyltransferase